MDKVDGGREGDWECSGCKNRNYAFRSFCNRCKQPRLLVDTKTPSDSKWLPRIGDWICTGCTNNNYASRDKCKKCGQPKEVAAMPAVALPGASLPTYLNYFSRAGGLEQKMNMGLIGTSGPHQSLPFISNSPVVGANKYGIPGPLAGNFNYGLPYENSGNQVSSVPKGWRNGDWICNCGFHNYSSRQQCKKCNAVLPALGTKRLASEDLAHEWDNKRLNLGLQSPANFEQVLRTNAELNPGLCTYPGISSSTSLNLPIPVPFPPPVNSPALFGKGAKQWRNGDWMCTNCNNHNYASRLQCNRCKTPRISPNLSVNVT